MFGASRLGDRCSGHGCFPPRINTSASYNVLVNGLGWHRYGDTWESHCCGKHCHGGVLDNGSNSVFINGKRAGRIGDAISCGSVIINGSNNVFVGD